MALKIAAFFTLLIGAGLMLLGLASVDEGIANSVSLWWKFFLQTGWIFGICSGCGILLIVISVIILVGKKSPNPIDKGF